MSKKNDAVEKNTIKLVNALLDADKCVVDILKPREAVVTTTKNKPAETLVSAFERGYGYLKDREEMWFKGVNAKFKYDELVEVFKRMDRNPPNRHLSLAKIISLNDVHQALALAGMAKWRDLDDDQKIEILWGMGLAVKGNPDNRDDAPSAYFIERRKHRNVHNKVVYGLCIMANERVDSEWKQNPQCSHEAKIFTLDVTLAKDLQEMGRGKY